MKIKRMKIALGGVVQGVGFRPFVYRLACSLGLKGYVLNSTKGVIIEVEGHSELLNRFYRLLLKNPPPLTAITARSVEFLKLAGFKNFKIRESREGAKKELLISPDIATCKKCLGELFSPSDRRFLYPFINCTDCGPRFTIITDLPYDRKYTTMKKFEMCEDCLAEYTDPLSRRYHAQPNACEKCGPQVRLISAKKGNLSSFSGYETIKKAAGFIEKGNIVAVKGVGGFHLMADACNQRVVLELRRKKMRPFKPFAIMSSDIEKVKEYCEVDRRTEELLLSPRRPIVLLKKRCCGRFKDIADAIAPNNNYLGVMLPYTPLHYLLLQNLHSPAIVATSANLQDQPLIFKDDEALQKLAGISEYFLLHNRDIENRVDDSIMQEMDGRGVILRRARGFVPLPVDTGNLRVRNTGVLGCGAELKNTFCLARDNLIFVSQHIGDLKNEETYNFYKEEIQKFQKFFDITPEIVVCDLHPDYLSTWYAIELKKRNKSLRIARIQHHYAHILSCMADNSLDENVIGVSFDGIGYGSDGNIWGGEFLVCGYNGFRRWGHLRYVPMPGGDRATEEPYRMAISYLSDAYGNDFQHINLPFVKRMDKKKMKIILHMIEQRVNSPLTSSMGRFFDAVSSLLGICDISTYEAQAAIELQMKAELAQSSGLRPQGYRYKIREQEGTYIVEPAEIIQEIVRDIKRGVPAEEIAYSFHLAIADIILTLCRIIRKKTGIKKIVLSGGVFQNKMLLEISAATLRENSFLVYTHRQVPPNDGGISLGQVVFGLKNWRRK